MAITTGDQAPEFDLEETHDTRVRLSDYRGRANVLLVFHPFAFTAVCEEEARDLQENLESFRNATNAFTQQIRLFADVDLDIISGGFHPVDLIEA